MEDLIDRLQLYYPTFHHWVALGVGLLLLELLLPGAYILWFGFAALSVGLLTYVHELTPTSQLLAFAVLGPLFALLGRALFRIPLRVSNKNTDLLNQKKESLVGYEFILYAPIHQGVSYALVDGVRWKILGADHPAGTRVRVAAVEGNALVVHHVENGSSGFTPPHDQQATRLKEERLDLSDEE
jgi:hypothetical protein